MVTGSDEKKALGGGGDLGGAVVFWMWLGAYGTGRRRCQQAVRGGWGLGGGLGWGCWFGDNQDLGCSCHYEKDEGTQGDIMQEGRETLRQRGKGESVVTEAKGVQSCTNEDVSQLFTWQWDPERSGRSFALVIQSSSWGTVGGVSPVELWEQKQI